MSEKEHRIVFSLILITIAATRVHKLIVCNNDTQEVSILSSYCLTSFNPPQNNCSNDAVAGRCIYSLSHGQATTGGNVLRCIQILSSKINSSVDTSTVRGDSVASAHGTILYLHTLMTSNVTIAKQAY